MHTVILYASKTGTAKKCADYMSKKLGGADTINLSTDTCALSKYDTVIIGSGIRMGRIHKQCAKYIEGNKSALMEKKLGLFVCAGFSDQASEKRYLEENFSAELRSHARAAVCLGGELDVDTLKGFDKLIAKMVTKADGGKPAPQIRFDAIDRFVKEMAE